jgi:hypothetical protein
MTETGGHEVVPVESIQGLDFKRSGILTGPGLHLNQSAAQNLLGAIAFEAPNLLHGEPLALPTGELSIRYTNAEGELWERLFEVLADALLRDLSFPNTVYPMAEPLRAALIAPSTKVKSLEENSPHV